MPRRTVDDEFVLKGGVEAAVAAVAAQGFLVVPLAGDVQVAADAQGNTAVEREVAPFPAAVAATGRVGGDPTAGVLAKHEIDDPGDGIGTVLRGRAVAQHLHPGERCGRDGAKIRAAAAPADHAVEHA